MTEETESRPSDFIREAIKEDLASGRYDTVHTRFPPEPNGYLHIGHVKAFNISFSIAEEFGGKANLRFDDTNPVNEREEYALAIQEDVRWMGCDWEDRLFYASDYFEQLYDWAVELIKKDKAFVCDQTDGEMREYRGTSVFDENGKRVTAAGKNSPYRDRSVEENLDLFSRMRAGDFEDGTKTLRAKIDMAHPNLNMRDPVMYRIMRMEHWRAGNTWVIYPMYDWTHGQSDSIEGITHSLCDIGFENHRPLYEWYLDQLGIHQPRQIEFSRLNLTKTVMSKRLLRQLVEENLVDGWDDPRLPTLRGLRRRGFTPAAIKDFLSRVGVAKTESTADVQLLEHCVRADLNKITPRVMGVLDPLKLVITNYPEGESEELAAINNPEDPEAGSRQIPFGRELYVECGDFMEDPPRKFHRLAIGQEVRLRYAFFVTCTKVVKDDNGIITEVHCTYDPETRGGDAPDGRKVRGTIHWVSAAHSVTAELRLYDHLFEADNPMAVAEGEDWKANLSPESLVVNSNAQIEPGMAAQAIGFQCQFERTGYFCVDKDSTSEKPVFNRTLSLRDTYGKKQKQPNRQKQKHPNQQKKKKK